MKSKSLDITYNKKYLVIVPYMSKELYDSFQYSFNNTILMKNNVEDINKTIEFINKNNFNQLIFVDYQVEYEQVINSLNNRHEIKFIFTKALGALSDSFVYYTFKGFHKFYEEKVATKIGFIDKGFYEVFKNKGENAEYICLDIEKKDTNESYDGKSIGILNSQDNSRHSFYNELSAIKLAGDYYAKLDKCNKTTKNFLKLFNINFKKSSTMNNNLVNLYINFTANNNLVFLQSMDSGVPCILGNNDILDGDLTKYLVVKSDDDINEMAEKINNIKKNRTEIMKKYEKFRKEYSIKSKETIERFLECDIEKEINEDSEILISIIVPVYNTEDYLEKSLESIINSIVDKTEILLINDGSTDNSEDIILKYQKKYPNLIRYIKQENHGLGNVRNVGLKEAKGKYIASIDSDDTIDEYFFNDCMKYLENNVDIVIYDWLTVTNEQKYTTPALDPIFNKESTYEGILYTTIMPSTCNKIIKKSLYDDLDLRFIEDKYEDLSANPFVLLKAKTIKYIRKPYYEYYIRSNSIMRSSAGYSMIDIIKIFEERLNKYKEYANIDLEKFKYYTYSWRVEEYIFNQLYSIDESEIETFINYINKNLYDTISALFESSYYKEMINKLKDKENIKYLNERNKAFKNKKLKEFIIKSRKKENFYKLTPAVILYGEW